MPRSPDRELARFFCFLRAINVGKGRVLKMDALRRAFESLSFFNVETCIASGNVVFDAVSSDAAQLTKRIDTKIAALLGYPAPAFLRTPAELRRIAAHPFTPSGDLPATEHVVFLNAPLSAGEKQQLAKLASELEEFFVRGRE